MVVDSIITFLEDLYKHGLYTMIVCSCKDHNHRCDYTHCGYCKSSMIPMHTQHCHKELFAKIYGGDIYKQSTQFRAERKSTRGVYTIPITLLDSYQDYKDVYLYDGITLVELINKIKLYNQYITNQDRLHIILQMVCIDNIKLIKVCLKELHMNGEITNTDAKLNEYLKIINQL